MSLVRVCVCLLLVLTAVSTAPSQKRDKRQEQSLSQGFPQHLQRFYASQQGSADPTPSQNSQNTPKFLPTGPISNHKLNISANDQDHITVSSVANEFSNDGQSLKSSVSKQPSYTASTEVKPSSDQKPVKDAATLQLEKMIEDQRLANIKHRERQLQQLEAAKAQLEKQIENQKQLQQKWLEDKRIENSELMEEEYTYATSNNSYTDKDSVMLSKAIQNDDVEIKDKVYKSTETTLTDRKELKTYGSEENHEEDQCTELLLAGSVSDNTNQGHEEVSMKEQKNTKQFKLASENEEDGNKDTSEEKFGDYTTENSLHFESIIEEETPFFDKEELSHPDKASSKLDIPQEVSDALDLVSRYFQRKNSNNLSAPKYEWRAVQELSNYLN